MSQDERGRLSRSQNPDSQALSGPARLLAPTSFLLKPVGNVRPPSPWTLEHLANMLSAILQWCRGPADLARSRSRPNSTEIPQHTRMHSCGSHSSQEPAGQSAACPASCALRSCKRCLQYPSDKVCRQGLWAR